MRFKRLLAVWVLAFAIFAGLAATAYALQPGSTALGHGLSLLLAPGTALYVLINGSLLFGGGLGRIGDAVVFVAGSAAVWSSLLVVAVLLVRALRSA